MSDLTDEEREFMMGGSGRGGGGFGRGRGAFGRGGGGNRRGRGGFGGFGGGPGLDNPNSAAMSGRRLKIVGLTEAITNDIVMRYFRKFGVVDDWSRDKSGTFGHLDFTESYMVDYCMKRPRHLVDGVQLTISRAEPDFGDNADQDWNNTFTREDKEEEQEGGDNNQEEGNGENVNDVD